MASLASLVAEYLAGPRLVQEAVAKLSRQQLLARPVAGKWSTLEAVCHLADFEPVFADRIKRVLADERPTLLGADENLFVAALAYHDRDLQEELEVITSTRRQLARILQHCSDQVLNRVGVHNQRGPLTLQQLLSGASNHIPHHLKFIQEKLAALAASG